MRSFLRRLLAIGSLVGFTMAAVVLLWADRGAALGTESLSTLADGFRTFEQTANIDLLDRGDIPGSVDQVGHAMLWATGTLLIGLAGFRRFSAAAAATTALLASLTFELGQPLLSTSRALQPGDVIANGIGVLIGFGALVVLHGASRLVNAIR